MIEKIPDINRRLLKKLLAGIVLLGLFFFLFLQARVAQAELPGELHFKELKSKYLKLRNTDPRASNYESWIQLARDFEEFVENNRSFSGAASALFNASILYTELFNNYSEKKHLNKSLGLLEKIAEDYSHSALADDSLVKAGDIYLYKFDDPDRAEEIFQSVIVRYPESDMYDVARARVAAVKSGSYKKVEVMSERFENRSMIPKKREGKPVVVIDPGHGGEDFGAVGKGGLLEKDVVLSVALELEKLLKEKLDATVYLTRRRDQFVPLADRTALANQYEADVFISLHCNATDSGNVKGLEIYYLDNVDDKSSRLLAERENASTRFEGPEGDLRYMLSDLIQGGKQGSSIVLANLVMRALFGFLKTNWGELKKLGVKKAPFYVLVGAHMPCVMVELMFINHETDGAYLARKAFREDAAFGLYLGIRNFLEHEGWKL